MGLDAVGAEWQVVPIAFGEKRKNQSRQRLLNSSVCLCHLPDSGEAFE